MPRSSRDARRSLMQVQLPPGPRRIDVRCFDTQRPIWNVSSMSGVAGSADMERTGGKTQLDERFGKHKGLTGFQC
jgi:hypothetical protein